MLELKPIKRSNLVDQVMESVKDYIISNNLEAGVKIAHRAAVLPDAGREQDDIA